MPQWELRAPASKDAASWSWPWRKAVSRQWRKSAGQSRTCTRRWGGGGAGRTIAAVVSAVAHVGDRMAAMGEVSREQARGIGRVAAGLRDLGAAIPGDIRPAGQSSNAAILGCRLWRIVVPVGGWGR